MGVVLVGMVMGGIMVEVMVGMRVEEVMAELDGVELDERALVMDGMVNVDLKEVLASR